MISRTPSRDAPERLQTFTRCLSRRVGWALNCEHLSSKSWRHTPNEKRVWVEGPAMLLEPNQAQTVAVALDELATNAAKYGALFVAEGNVHIGWSQPAARRFILRWIETDGPHVAPPSRQGFGTRVIDSMLRQLKGDVRFDWHAEGLFWEISLPV
jgi:two-component sensor histidine kinase